MSIQDTREIAALIGKTGELSKRVDDLRNAVAEIGSTERPMGGAEVLETLEAVNSMISDIELCWLECRRIAGQEFTRVEAVG